MKITWENIKELAERNAIYLDEVPEAFLDKDVKMTEEELITLLLLLLDDFEVEDGLIKKNRHNFFLINKVDVLFNGFIATTGLALMGRLIDKLQKVVTNNSRLYSVMYTDRSGFNRTKKNIIEMVNRRLGFDAEGKMKPAGYLDDLMKMNTVKNNTRELFYRNVTAKTKVNDFRKVLQGFIVGDKDKGGAIYSFYSKFAYDSFSQIDRMASAEFAAQMGLTKFIYAGKLIKSSRKFCIKKIHGIYTMKEAERWPYEDPAPIGISVATYNPAIDMGGVNCKHMPVFITEEMVEDLEGRGFVKVPYNN